MGQVPISLVFFPSDIMVSLTTLALWIQLMKISHGVPHLLIIIAIMYQVEAIMVTVDQSAQCLLPQELKESQVIHVVQINFSANQGIVHIPITVTVMVHVFKAVG